MSALQSASILQSGGASASLTQTADGFVGSVGGESGTFEQSGGDFVPAGLLDVTVQPGNEE